MFSQWVNTPIYLHPREDKKSLMNAATQMMSAFDGFSPLELNGRSIIGWVLGLLLKKYYYYLLPFLKITLLLYVVWHAKRNSCLLLGLLSITDIACVSVNIQLKPFSKGFGVICEIHVSCWGHGDLNPPQLISFLKTDIIWSLLILHSGLQGCSSLSQLSEGKGGQVKSLAQRDNQPSPLTFIHKTI